MDSAPKNRDSNRQLGLLQELWMFMRVRKKFWLAPIVLALLLLGLLMIAAHSAGVVSPFVYMF